jgi:hypothetical protein
MVRFTDYSPAIPIAGGAGVTVIPYQALRGSNVVAFTISMTATGNVLNATNGLSRLRVLVNGNVWWDCAANHLVAFTERFSKSNINLGTTAAAFMIPFFDPIPEREDEQDVMQLPAGQPEIQLTFGSASTAGFIEVGIIRTTIRPQSTSRLYGQAMNIAASQLNASYLFSAPGVMRGVVMNRTGVSRAILSLGGVEVLKFTGPQYTPAAETAVVSQQWYSPVAFTDPIAFYLGEQYPAPAEGTNLLLDTGNAWGGVGNEMTRYVAIPYAGAV